MSTHAVKEKKKPIIFNTGRLFCFNSTVSYTYSTVSLNLTPVVKIHVKSLCRCMQFSKSSFISEITAETDRSTFNYNTIHLLSYNHNFIRYGGHFSFDRLHRDICYISIYVI